MDFIIADDKGMEIAILEERQYIDIDVGGKNDFEIHLSQSAYNALGIKEGYRICVPGEEYGGIIDKIKSLTTNDSVILSGATWRGMLGKKVIVPPDGMDYKTVNGEANQIIRQVACSEFDGLFICTGISDIHIENYKFERYVDMLSGIENMLLSKSARIHLEYDSGEQNGAGFVRLKAVPIHDYSDEIEYSKDGTLAFLTFSFERYTGGINHLICLGKGSMKDRSVVHLYVQEDGSIGNAPFFKGRDERTSVYDYSNTESVEELQKKGIEQLKKLMSYTNMDMDLKNQTLEGSETIGNDISVGDIVGGRDFNSGIYLSKQITQKIIQVKDGRETINYKVGGNSLNRSTASAPAEPEDKYQQQIDVINSGLSNFINNFAANLLAKIYPVGSIYMSVSNVSPATFLGGTWTAWGSGRVPVGVNASDSNFNAVEKTGGANTHTLTTEQIPSHRHSIPALSGTAASGGAHTHTIMTEFGEGNLNKAINPGDNAYAQVAGSKSGSKVWRNGSINSAGAHTHSVTTAANNTGYSGSGTSHNNLQPYITCYMWKRTA